MRAAEGYSPLQFIITLFFLSSEKLFYGVNKWESFTWGRGVISINENVLHKNISYRWRFLFRL